MGVINGLADFQVGLITAEFPSQHTDLWIAKPFQEFTTVKKVFQVFVHACWLCSSPNNKVIIDVNFTLYDCRTDWLTLILNTPLKYFLLEGLAMLTPMDSQGFVVVRKFVFLIWSLWLYSMSLFPSCLRNRNKNTQRAIPVPRAIYVERDIETRHTVVISSLAEVYLCLLKIVLYTVTHVLVVYSCFLPSLFTRLSLILLHKLSKTDIVFMNVSLRQRTDSHSIKTTSHSV